MKIYKFEYIEEDDANYLMAQGIQLKKAWRWLPILLLEIALQLKRIADVKEKEVK